jgi:hypothetical protein
MSRYEVLLDATAPGDEVEAVARLVHEAGLDAEVIAAYERRSIESLPFIIMLGFPLSVFLGAFSKSYGTRLGEHAADGTRDATRHLLRWVHRLYESRSGDGQVVLNDDEHNLQIMLNRDLTEDAAEALWAIDPARDGGESGHLSWDPRGRWQAPW